MSENIEFTPDKSNPIPIDRQEARLGLQERNTVQIKIMEKMLRSESTEEQLKWVEDYGKIVSDIIDDPKSIEIRKLIEEGDADETKYDQAADLVISLLRKPQISRAA